MSEKNFHQDKSDFPRWQTDGIKEEYRGSVSLSIKPATPTQILTACSRHGNHSTTDKQPHAADMGITPVQISSRLLTLILQGTSPLQTRAA